jgi:hypothetical protein
MRVELAICLRDGGFAVLDAFEFLRGFALDHRRLAHGTAADLNGPPGDVAGLSDRSRHDLPGALFRVQAFVPERGFSRLFPRGAWLRRLPSLRLFLKMGISSAARAARCEIVRCRR